MRCRGLFDARPLFVRVLGPATDIAQAPAARPSIAGKLTGVWIGGNPYPAGGWEYKLYNAPRAADTLMRSKAAIWQVPHNVAPGGTQQAVKRRAALAAPADVAARLAGRAVQSRRAFLYPATGAGVWRGGVTHPGPGLYLAAIMGAPLWQ